VNRVRNTTIDYLKSWILVPAVNQASTHQGLRDRHSLLLITRYTTNSSVSNEDLPRVAKAEDSGEDVGDDFDVFVPALAIRLDMWGTSLGRKPDRFLNGEGRETNVVFGEYRTSLR
jgi:hypothetical protein